MLVCARLRVRACTPMPCVRARHPPGREGAPLHPVRPEEAWPPPNGPVYPLPVLLPHGPHAHDQRRAWFSCCPLPPPVLAARHGCSSGLQCWAAVLGCSAGHAPPILHKVIDCDSTQHTLALIGPEPHGRTVAAHAVQQAG